MSQVALAGLSAVILASAAPARAGTYVVTTLPLQQYLNFAVFGLNDNDQVVGRAEDTADHGFLWSSGVLTQVDDPNAAATHLNRIDNTGLAAGTYYTDPPGGDDILFAYDTKKATFKKINLKGKDRHNRAGPTSINQARTIAGVDSSINSYFVAPAKGKPVYTVPSDYLKMGGDGEYPTLSDAGALVTNYFSTSGPEYCGVYQTGQWTSISYPPNTAGLCHVNGAGTLFGNLGSTGNSYGFLYSSGNFTYYQYPNDPTGTKFVGVNAGGEILGIHTGGMFVYVNGSYHPITVNGNAGQPIAINALGSIVGMYTNNSGTYAFIAQCPPNQRPCTR